MQMSKVFMSRLTLMHRECLLMTMINANHDNAVSLFIYKLVLRFMYEKSFMTCFCKYQGQQVFSDHDPFIMLLVLTECSMFGKRNGIQEFMKLNL